jgi:hypothetical protein
MWVYIHPASTDFFLQIPVQISFNLRNKEKRRSLRNQGRLNVTRESAEFSNVLVKLVRLFFVSVKNLIQIRIQIDCRL